MQTVDKELSKYTLDAIKTLEELDYRIDIITYINSVSKSSSISPKMVPMVEGDNLIRSLFRIGELRESILDKVILLKLVEEEEVLSYVGDLLSSEFKESIKGVPIWGC